MSSPSKVFTCDRCRIDFKTKAQLTSHNKKKKPCEPSTLVQAIIKANPELVQKPDGPFRERSLKMNAALDKKFRQDNGIFFTPKKARDLLFEKLKMYNFTATKILEPSFGTGEFLEDASNIYPQAKLYGVELNEKLYKSYTNPKATLSNGDFLKYRNVRRMDLIIGNPPYFVMEDKDAKNPKCMVGRPNIYIAFLYKCLEEHLADNGYLGFVLPTSLFNCSYYEPMRKYIADKCTVAFVKELDVEYYETNQDTMLIIIKKTPDPEQKYIFKRNGKSYISPYYLELEELVKGTKTLYELNLRVKTGDIVWNNEAAKIKVKGKIIDGPDRLTNDKTGENTFRLIYPSNITSDCKLIFGNKNKKEFIKNFRCPPVDAPAILVNRGFGNASAEYGFVYAFVDTTSVENGKFYAENHLNVITGLDANAKKLIPDVLKSLGNEKTAQFVKYFNANGSMSKTELELVLPVFI